MFVLQFLVILVALVITGFLGVKFKTDDRGNTYPKIRAFPLVTGIVFLVIWFFAVMPAFGQVPAGNRGVVLRFGGVTGEILNEGLYWVTPFVSSVVLMDVQTHAYQAKTVEAASHDLQQVGTQVTVNYRLDPAKVAEIYRDLRNDYQDRIMLPAIQETVKSSTAQYEAEKLITNRAAVKSAIDSALETRLSTKGIIVDAVQITDFKFSDEFEKAIESKVTAEQLALKAQNDLVRIRTEAEQAVAKANGEASAIQAKGDALRNNPELVQLNAVERWDGKLPQNLYTGTGAIPFIQVAGAAVAR